jgi:DNA-binding NtrC family response regulator
MLRKPIHSAPVDTTAPDGLPAVLRGSSAPALQQRRQVARAIAAGEPVLILGETGLDAGQVALAVHEPRRQHPWHALDCVLSATDNLEERLFGRAQPAPHRRRDLDVVSRRSALLAAGRGTLFLANVTEMGAGIQRRLAWVLRDGEVYVDDRAQPVPLQARVVASASPDILEDVAAGRFRAGLYRRFSAWQIELAPLRARPEDIAEIVRVLSGEIGARKGVPPRAFTTAALTALASLSWPRNLDELRELVERLHSEASNGAARQEDVLRALGFGHPAPPHRGVRFDSLRLARRLFERDYISAVLERHGWRVAEAAATLGIERANLYRKIRQLGLPRPPNGAPEGP